jgi:hypothetical protein
MLDMRTTMARHARACGYILVAIVALALTLELLAT